MRKVRLTPDALNSPLEILGVQRVVFFVLLVISLVVTQKYRWDVGVMSFLVCFGIAQLINRKGAGLVLDLTGLLPLSDGSGLRSLREGIFSVSDCGGFE
jgi:hypothetical protein